MRGGSLVSQKLWKERSVYRWHVGTLESAVRDVGARYEITAPNNNNKKYGNIVSESQSRLKMRNLWEISLPWKRPNYTKIAQSSCSEYGVIDAAVQALNSWRQSLIFPFLRSDRRFSTKEKWKLIFEQIMYRNLDSWRRVQWLYLMQVILALEMSWEWRNHSKCSAARRPTIGVEACHRPAHSSTVKSGFKSSPETKLGFKPYSYPRTIQVHFGRWWTCGTHWVLSGWDRSIFSGFRCSASIWVVKSA